MIDTRDDVGLCSIGVHPQARFVSNENKEEEMLEHHEVLLLPSNTVIGSDSQVCPWARDFTSPICTYNPVKQQILFTFIELTYRAGSRTPSLAQAPFQSMPQGWAVVQPEHVYSDVVCQ